MNVAPKTAAMIFQVRSLPGPLPFVESSGSLLCELPCDATYLHDGTSRREGKNDRHLKHYLKHIADIIRAKIIKTLRAIAALKQKRFALAGARKLGF